MASAAVQDGQFNKILQCSICIDVFTDPRTLPCLHTFCFKCIAAWCKDMQPGNQATCPQCRDTFVIPDIGTNGIKKNFFIANMLCMNDEVKPTEGDPCETCASEVKKVSEMFCVQCEQSYCESCSKVHLKIKNCKSHKLVRLDELEGRVNIVKKYRQQYCDKHTDKLIELYCSDDEVAICMMCYALDHRSHHCEETKDIASQFRSGKWKQDLQTSLRKVDEKLVLLKSRKLSFSDQLKSVEKKICEEADKKIRLIKYHKQNLVSILQNIKTKHERHIDKVSEELTQAKALLSTFTDYCDELSKKGSDVDICREKNSLCRRTEELVNMKNLENDLRKLRVINVIFTPSNTTLEDAKSVLGEIAIVKSGVFDKSDDKLTLPGAATVTGESGVLSESKHKAMSPVTSTVTGDPRLLLTLSQPPTDSNGLHGLPHQVNGVAMLDKCLCVVYWRYDKVQVFDCEDSFKKIKEIQVKGMCPGEMVGSSVTSQLFVSDWGNGNICRVDVNTGLSDVFIKLGCSASLSLVENRLLVTSRDSLLMYDIHSGQRTQNIPWTGDMKKYVVWHAIESNRNSFFVSHGDACNSTVSEIDSEGRVIRVFGNYEQLRCGHLALDSAGRLLVVDRNNKRVVLLDEHLQYLRILLGSEQLGDAPPWSLSYNKNNNRLAVGLVNGHVKIFDCLVY